MKFEQIDFHWSIGLIWFVFLIFFVQPKLNQLSEKWVGLIRVIKFSKNKIKNCMMLLQNSRIMS